MTNAFILIFENVLKMHENFRTELHDKQLSLNMKVNYSGKSSWDTAVASQEIQWLRQAVLTTSSSVVLDMTLAT